VEKELTANQYYILREKEQSALSNEFHDNHKKEITFARVVNCLYFVSETKFDSTGWPSFYDVK
jgi:peptide methionine sulfoxide reductase MsrB